MFIGHFGAALAAKNIDKNPSLATMFAASQFIDLLWPIFLLTGLEKVTIDPGNTAFTPLDFEHYPYSHSLGGVLLWAILFGGTYFVIKRNIKGSIILGTLVLSHWILDLLTHRPDLPLIPGSDLKLGLGLWNSIILTILIEGGIFAAGTFLYIRSHTFPGKRQAAAFWSLIALLVIIYIANIFGPAPPGPEPVAWSAMLMWLFVLWAWFADKQKTQEPNNELITDH